MMRKWSIPLALLMLTGCSLKDVKSYEADVLNKCLGPQSRLHAIGERVMENGLIAVGYADEKDILRVVAFVVNPPAPDLRKLPIMYELDVNGDKQPDVLVADTKGDGTCDGFTIRDDYRSNSSQSHNNGVQESST